MQVWDAMTFSSSRWKSKRQEPFEVSCIADVFAVAIANFGALGLCLRGGGVVTKVDSAASVDGHEFGRNYRGTTR